MDLWTEIVATRVPHMSPPLFVFVEQYSINIFSYSFSPKRQLASDLLANSSMVTGLAVQQLPAFEADSASTVHGTFSLSRVRNASGQFGP